MCAKSVQNISICNTGEWFENHLENISHIGAIQVLHNIITQVGCEGAKFSRKKNYEGGRFNSISVSWGGGRVGFQFPETSIM